MERLLVWIEHISDWLWGPPLIILLTGTGLYFTILLKGFQFRYPLYIFKQTIGSVGKKPKGRGHSHTASGIDLSPQFNDRCSEHCRCARRYYVWGTGSGFLDVAYCLICHVD